MTPARKRDLAASVKQRLLNLGRETVVVLLARFLVPVFRAIRDEGSFDSTWTPGRGWELRPGD